MAYVHPDKWSPSDWREHFATVRQMRKANWRAWVKCANCGGWWDLNLSRVELELGPDYSLWGRNPKCRTMLCKARASIHVLPPHVSRPFKLDGPSVQAKPPSV